MYDPSCEWRVVHYVKQVYNCRKRLPRCKPTREWRNQLRCVEIKWKSVDDSAFKMVKVLISILITADHRSPFLSFLSIGTEHAKWPHVMPLGPDFRVSYGTVTLVTALRALILCGSFAINSCYQLRWNWQLPHGLVARIHGSHPWGPGSIPGAGTCLVATRPFDDLV